MRMFLATGLFLLLSMPTRTLQAQQSSWLLQPENCFGYVDSCAQFWSGVWDLNRGGFYTHVNRVGSISGSGKNTLSQSRDVYGLVRAFQLSGNESYLDLAREGLEWMYEHAWDEEHGGWFDWMDNQGNPESPTATKSAFNQHYGLLGLAAFVDATRDTTMRRRLIEGYDFIESRLWDERPGFEGYFDHMAYNGTNAQGKSFNATVDAVTTHLIPLALMEDDPRYRERLSELADQMVNRLGASMGDQAIGFAETYDSDWNIEDNETMTIMGHVLKTAWCLGRIHRLNGDGNLLNTASQMLDEVWTLGYDQELGGPYKDFNRVTGQMLMWGNPDTAKAWWQMEQAVTAGLELQDLLPGSSPALEMAEGSIDFFMEFFVDPIYGEVYENRTRHGAQTWGTGKGGGGKAGYHSIETGYYLYLYSKLLLNGGTAPADLHYRMDPVEEDRVLHLLPLAAMDGSIRISAAWLDGIEWNGFEANSCDVLLPAGTGGHFVFRFEPVGANRQEAVAQIDRSFELLAAYPNPFNGRTNIPFKLNKAGNVRISLFDLQGRKLRQLLSQHLGTGLHDHVFESSGLPSGSYLLEMESQHGKQVQRILLLR